MFTFSILLFVRLSNTLWKYILESFINLDKQYKQTDNCDITEMLNCGYLFEMSEISYIIWFNGLSLMKLTCLRILVKWLSSLIYHEACKERRTFEKTYICAGYITSIHTANEWLREKYSISL